MNAMTLECMLVSLACPFMHLVCHKSGSMVYQSHTINFLKGQFLGQHLFHDGIAIPHILLSCDVDVMMKFMKQKCTIV